MAALQYMKVTMPTIRGRKPFSGERYGLMFINGSAVCTNEYLANRLSNKFKTKPEKITKTDAEKMGYVSVEKEESEK